MKLRCPRCGERGKIVWEYGIYRCQTCKGYFLSEEAEKAEEIENSDSERISGKPMKRT